MRLLNMKNEKFIFVLFLALILISNISAEDAIPNLGTYKQSECVRLIQICDMGCSYVTITSILGPNNNSELEAGMSMSSIDTYSWYYDFCNTSYVGTYTIVAQGDNGDLNDIGFYQFVITPNGEQISTGQSVAYIIFFFVLISLMLVVPFIINKLPAMNTRDEEGKIIQVNYLKYLRSSLWFAEYMLFTAFIFIAGNVAKAYLTAPLMGEMLMTMFFILMGLALPIVVVWFIWIFAKAMEDKEIKQLLNRGIFPGEQI